MDFFTAQKQAKRRTVLLLSVLIATVTLLTLFTYAVFIIAYLQLFQIDTDAFIHEPTAYIKLQHLLFLAGMILFVILFAMFKKWQELKQGGQHVAIALGASAIYPNDATTSERRALNVVEEMALASGISGIALFKLHDDSINAFAAGTELNNAVIALTTGCINQLNREELQAVVAHEFSHIFHADMKLNAHTSAIIYGMVAIGNLGRSIFRHSRGHHSSYGSSRDNKQGAAILYIYAVAIALIIIGYVGNLAGAIIQASISRKREFLADATAVQYTRYPQALASALHKIKQQSSELDHSNATLFSHFFFTAIAGNIFATHPPIDERIRRVDPTFFSAKRRESFQKAKQKKETTATRRDTMFQQMLITEAALHDAAHTIERDQHLLETSVPDALSAQALLCLLLFDSAQEKAFLKALQKQPMILQQFLQLQRELDSTLIQNPFDLLLQTLSRLQTLSPIQRSAFLSLLEELALIDDAISMKELAMIAIVSNSVQNTATQKPGDNRHAISIFLSYIAQQNCTDSQHAQQSVHTIATRFNLKHITYKAVIEPHELFHAMRRVTTLKGVQRQALFDATLATLRIDKKVTNDEYLLVKILAKMLDLALPYTFHQSDA